MDSFELNKIIGAVLGTLLFVMGIGFLAEAIYHPIEGRGPGYTLPEPEGGGGEEGEGEEAMVALASIGTLLQSASTEDGQDSARKCGGCHNFAEGGPNGQGPNLWEVVGRPIASHPGFAYSEAMVAHAQEAPNWTYEELNLFLLAPKEHVPGTKMNYNGVKDDAERANIIAYLSTLSASPLPFPEPEAATEDAAAATEGEAAAEGEAPASDVPAPPAENQVVDPTETTQTETSVEGTPTGTNTPAGAPETEAVTPAPPVDAGESEGGAVETPEGTSTETTVEGTPVQPETTEAPPAAQPETTAAPQPTAQPETPETTPAPAAAPATTP